ncbi:MAG: recombinase family protein [Dermatophilaceae bacterium]
MKPFIYGYVRAVDETSDNELDRLVSELQRYAETEGFCYATTFFERQEGSYSASEELVAELKRAEARHVVVPSMDHLSAHRLLGEQMVARLAADADVHVRISGSA